MRLKIFFFIFFLLHPAASLLARERPHILLIVIDTLRADHLSSYGYGRKTTPHMDSIAERGLVFKNASSVAPWTNPSIATLFSGKYPRAVFPVAEYGVAITQVLSDDVETIAERFGQEGYFTAAIVDSPALRPENGFQQGFERYYTQLDKRLDPQAKTRIAKEAPWEELPVREVFRKFKEIFGRREQSPVFVYLHLLYPHFPYTPPDPFDALHGPGYKTHSYSRHNPGEKNGLINMYDGEISRTDALVGMIWEYLQEHGLLSHTHVIITSDHGEGFGEHDLWEHGNSVYEELLHVPLILRLADAGGPQPRVFHVPVSTVDLYPTLLELAGIDPPAHIDGRSLSRYYQPEQTIADSEPVYGESPHQDLIMQISVKKDGYKLIYRGDYRHAGNSFFNLNTDPAEQHNLLEGALNREQRDLYHDMIQRLLAHREKNSAYLRTLSHTHTPLKHETLQMLRSLGYLQ